MFMLGDQHLLLCNPCLARDAWTMDQLMSAFVNTLKTAYNKLIAKAVPKQITQCDKAKWRLFQQLFISLAMLTRASVQKCGDISLFLQQHQKSPKKGGKSPNQWRNSTFSQSQA